MTEITVTGQLLIAVTNNVVASMFYGHFSVVDNYLTECFELNWIFFGGLIGKIM